MPENDYSLGIEKMLEEAELRGFARGVLTACDVMSSADFIKQKELYKRLLESDQKKIKIFPPPEDFHG